MKSAGEVEGRRTKIEACRNEVHGHLFTQTITSLAVATEQTLFYVQNVLSLYVKEPRIWTTQAFLGSRDFPVLRLPSRTIPKSSSQVNQYMHNILFYNSRNPQPVTHTYRFLIGINPKCNITHTGTANITMTSNRSHVQSR